MKPLAKRWQVMERLSPEADQELQQYHPILRQMLFNRGYSTQDLARRYLEGLSPDNCDPLLMKGMPEAVKRTVQAIHAGELIAIYGDYDADGVTATALLVQTLKALRAKVIGYIPNRFEEGYGLNNEALQSLSEGGVNLVISVDCGIRSFVEAAHAKELGLDLIITDHHHPDKTLPEAYAIINPKQAGDSYPEKNLAGVGIAYKLAEAIVDEIGPDQLQGSGFRMDDLLDLVALGTVADLAPLSGENRALVRAGLRSLRHCKRQGLLSLMGVAGVKPERLTSTDIGFILGPRLNAAGRLESALAALELLTTTSLADAGRLAQQLDNQNRERQRLTQQIQIQAEKLALAEAPDSLLLFAAHPDFNPGVVGLAASRLSDLYYRPAIVAYQGEEVTRGSCRSIPEFHITEALDQCADLLSHHGGHAAAAGFTVRNENLPELVSRLREIAQSTLSELDLLPVLVADIELPLNQLHPKLLDFLDLLQPTGYDNRQAMFVSRNLKVRSCRTVGRENTHLKLIVSDDHITYDAIAFRQGHWYGQMPPLVDLIYTFEINEFNGRTSLQLNVRDLKPSNTPD
jgi:single-stranded-DNA-specific exonuclease